VPVLVRMIGEYLSRAPRGFAAYAEFLHDPKFRVVTALVVRDGTRVLLVRRRGRKAWCLPGRALAPQISVHDSLMMEFLEQTGSLPPQFRLHSVHSIRGRRLVLLVFCSEGRMGGPPSPKGWLIAETRSFERDALPPLQRDVATLFRKVPDLINSP
jgi:ADP-ribose pyrophosphatase YjhB (NUDIX family)